MWLVAAATAGAALGVHRAGFHAGAEIVLVVPGLAAVAPVIHRGGGAVGVGIPVATAAPDIASGRDGDTVLLAAHLEFEHQRVLDGHEGALRVAAGLGVGDFRIHFEAAENRDSEPEVRLALGGRHGHAVAAIRVDVRGGDAFAPPPIRFGREIHAIGRRFDVDQGPVHQ